MIYSKMQIGIIWSRAYYHQHSVALVVYENISRQVRYTFQLFDLVRSFHVSKKFQTTLFILKRLITCSTYTRNSDVPLSKFCSLGVCALIDVSYMV